MARGALQVRVTIKGLDELGRNLGRLGPQMAKRVLKPSLQRFAGSVLSDAKDLAPIDTSQLRRNTRILDPQIEFIGGQPSEINTGFVFLQKYAAAQHENLFFRHPGGGQAKFAEVALQKRRTDFQSAVGRAVRSLLGS